jgi:uncharacterized delta-60 repeat protein
VEFVIGQGFQLDPAFSIETEDHADDTFIRIQEDANGKILISGMSTSGTVNIGGAAVGSLARFTASGELDNSFQLDTRIVETFQMAFDPGGRLYVGAGLEEEQVLQGQPAYRLLRLAENGEIDPTFTSPLFSEQPRYITFQPNGKILVSSGNESSDGPRDGVVKIDGTLIRLNMDGSLDSGFNSPNLDGGAVWTTPAVDEAGNIYLGGQFSTVNGNERKCIVRLLPDGSVDPQWIVPQNTFGDLTYIRGIKLLENGDVFIGGRIRPSDGTRLIFATLSSSGGAIFNTVESSGGISTAREFMISDTGTVYTVDNALAAFSMAGELLWSHRFSLSEQALSFERMTSGRLIVPVTGEIRSFSSNGTPDMAPFLQVPVLAENFYPDADLHKTMGLAVGGQGNQRIDGTEAVLAYFDATGTMTRFYSGEDMGREVLSYSTGTYVQGFADSASGFKFAADGTLSGSAILYWEPGVSGYSATDSFEVTAEGTLNLFPDTQNPIIDGLRLSDGRIVRSSGDYRPAFLDEYFVDDSAMLEVHAGYVVHAYQVAPQHFLEANPEGLDKPLFTALKIQPLIEYQGGVLLALGKQVLLADLNQFREIDSFKRIELSTTRYQKPPASMSYLAGGPLGTDIYEEEILPDIISATIDVGDGAILVGEFEAANGIPAPGILRIDADGNLDTEFLANLGTGPATPDGSQGIIEAVVQDQAGWIHVAGRFTSFSGAPAPGFVTLYPDGTPLPGMADFENKLLGVHLYTDPTMAWRARARLLVENEKDLILIGPYGSAETGFNSINRIRRDAPESLAFTTSIKASANWAVSLTHGWHSLPGSGWIFSSLHGYQYIYEVDEGRFWAYDVGLQALLFFDTAIHPYIYYAGEPSGYLHLLEASIRGNRFFRDYRNGKDGSIISESEM